ncbi:hypothetical protein [Rhodococcus sp. O3]|uniref:hypothetical protein n=1 Tax=Rhodococcus sp. O3 TaxID=3404919 RepID=UPI003B6858A4
MSIKLLALQDDNHHLVTKTTFESMARLELESGGSYLVIATGTVWAASLDRNETVTVRLSIRTGIVAQIESKTEFSANPSLSSTGHESFALTLAADSVSGSPGPGPVIRPPSASLSAKKNTSGQGGFAVSDIRIAALPVDEIVLTTIAEQ